MRRLLGVCAAALVALGASEAGAAVLFSDGFDTDMVKSTGWFANDDQLANFTVTSGSVDLIAANNMFGLTGPTNTGNFVDLDGTSGHGGTLQTIKQFSFAAGDTVTLDIKAAGNQRNGSPDGLFAGFVFSGTPSFTDLVTTGFTSNSTVGNELLGNVTLGSDAPWQDFTITFTAVSAGSVGLLVGTDSNDNIGPLLDEITLGSMMGATLVPEPSAWALMLLGFGGAGLMLRQRRMQMARVAA
jgi:hypothetical protein